MKVVCLAGGVGGAKLAFGLSRAVPPEELTVVVNIGDAVTHLGLRICPDLDTVTYTLAGLENRETGWGLAGDTFQALDALSALEGPAWFRLGDRDLATHLWRTALLAEGLSLTQVTRRICESLGVHATLLPASDTPAPTRVETDEGVLDFQDYFVRRRCEPRVSRIILGHGDAAAPSGDVQAALTGADAVVFAPSNPFVSIDPILALPGVRDAVRRKPSVAVSPIVGGDAIKGPAAKMMRELGLEVSPVAVARRYRGLVGGFVMDVLDNEHAPSVEAEGFKVCVAQSIMRTDADRESLARRCLELVAGVEPAEA